MEPSENGKNRIVHFIAGIILLLLSAGALIIAIRSVVRTARDARYYNTSVDGTVISSSVKTDTDSDNHSQTYSIVNIQYDALNGETRTLSRQYLTGEYREGAHIALRCTEDRTEAVPESATHHDPVFLVILFFAALLSGLIGIFLLSGKALQ